MITDRAKNDMSKYPDNILGELATARGVDAEIAQEAEDELNLREKRLAQAGTEITAKLSEPDASSVEDEDMSEYPNDILEELATAPGVSPEIAQKAGDELETRDGHDTQADAEEDAERSGPRDGEDENAEEVAEGIDEPAADIEDDHLSKYPEYENAPSRTRIQRRASSANSSNFFRRQWERIKDDDKEPSFDKRRGRRDDPNRIGFYKQAENEGLPEKAEANYTEAEILRDAERQIRSHLGELLTTGFMAEFRSGNMSPDAANVLALQYEGVINRRAYRYGSQENFSRIKGVISESVVPRVLSELRPEEIDSIQRIALENLVEQGVKTEEDELGNVSYQLSIPSSFSIFGSRAEQFSKKYGAAYESRRSSAVFLRQKGINFEDAKLQNKSFHGFFKIAEALRNTHTADTSRLDWYFENFNYSDPAVMARFIDSMQNTRSIDEDTRDYIVGYLEQKPAYNKYLEGLNSDETIDSEQDALSDAIDNISFHKSDEAIEQIFAAFGLNKEEVEGGIYVDDYGGGILERGGRYGEYLGNHVIKTSEDHYEPFDPNDPSLQRESDPEMLERRRRQREKYERGPKPRGKTIERAGTIRRGEDYALQKAITIAILFRAIQKIDPDAEIGIAGDKNDDQPDPDRKDGVLFDEREYLIIRFGCSSIHMEPGGQMVMRPFNHVIAENITPVGATYLWYGDGNSWQNDLKGRRQDVLRRENVSRKTHGAKQTLTAHLIDVIRMLGIDPAQLFANQGDIA